MIVETFRVFQKLEQCLCRFRILDGKECIHGVDVEKGLDYLSLLAPGVAIGQKKNVRLVGAYNVIADVVCGTTGVDRTFFVEQAGVLSIRVLTSLES